MGKATAEKPEAAPAPVDAESVRDELLSMLNTAGQRPPAPARPPAERPVAPREAVSVKKVAPAKAVAAAEEPEVDPNACANCGSLEPWGASSWCPKCGYYPALGHAGRIDETETERDISEFTLGDFFPRWLVTLLGGCLFISVGSALMETYLDGNEGFLSLASLVQVAFGAILLMSAHLSAYLSGIRLSSDVSLKDFLTNPPAVWIPVLKRLPDTSHLLTNASWGLTATVSALLIFGPIRMGAIKEELAKKEEAKPKKTMMGTLIGSVAQATGAANQNAGSQPQSIDEAVEAFAGIATESGGLNEVIENSANGGGGEGGAIGDEGDSALDAGSGGEFGDEGASNGEGGEIGDGHEGGAAGDPGDKGEPGSSPNSQAGAGQSGGRSTSTTTSTPASTTTPASGTGKRLHGVIFGYLSNSSGDVRAVLLAENDIGGRPQFCGKLSEEDFSVEQWTELERELPTVRARRPLVSCPFGGAWVVPVYRVEAEYESRLYNNFEGTKILSLTRNEPAAPQ